MRGIKLTLPSMKISPKQVGPWEMLAITFEKENFQLSFPVLGIIGNSVTTTPAGRNKLKNWKLAVANTAKEHRKAMIWESNWIYSISFGFSFHRESHGQQELDVDNFLKPTIDALAAGLFCSKEQDVAAIKRFNYDDSNFRYLFPHKLQDARDKLDEGTAICISVIRE